MENYPNPEELRKMDEKRKLELSKKRDKRLKHIQKHLLRILENTFPADAPNYQIDYEIMTEYPEPRIKTNSSLYGKVRSDHSPAYRFTLTRKDHPNEKYEIMHLLKPDIDRNVKLSDIPQHYQLEGLGNEHIKEGIERLKRINNGLESTQGIASIILIVGSLFFLSFNLTGYSIADISITSLNYIGVILFIIGLITAFLYFRKK